MILILNKNNTIGQSICFHPVAKIQTATSLQITKNSHNLQNGTDMLQPLDKVE